MLRPRSVAFAALAAVAILLAPACAHAGSKKRSRKKSIAPAQVVDPPAQRIIGAAFADGVSWKRLRYLSDWIGPRLSGSKNLEKALDWAETAMKADGLKVYRQPVKVPHWVRGEEAAELVAPIARPLHILGLGGSVGTGGEWLEAEVVVASSFEELDALGAAGKVKDRIVVMNAVMPADIHPFEAYGKSYRFRAHTASASAKHGAKAALVRSLTTRSLQTPHTGTMRYEEGVAKIPTAAITVEDATWIARLVEDGATPRLRLRMEAEMKGEVDSANLIGELMGREKPDEIVLVGGHIDAWDVGTGATDDGTGIVGAMEAAGVIARLGLKPRRTIRVVLFTNEENGLKGATAYAEKYGGDKHVAVCESDSGSARPVGFSFAGSEESLAQAQTLLGPNLSLLGVDEIWDGFSGADVGHLEPTGVPGFGLRSVPDRYFDIHHTHADTLDKIDPVNIRMQVAAFALWAWTLADAERTLPRHEPTQDEAKTGH